MESRWRCALRLTLCALASLVSFPVLALDETESCLLADDSLMSLVAGDHALGFTLTFSGDDVRVSALRASRIVGERALSLSGTDCETRVEALRFVVQTMRRALVLAPPSAWSTDAEPLASSRALAPMAEGLARPPSRMRAQALAARPAPSVAPPRRATPRDEEPLRGFVFLGVDLTTGRVPSIPVGPVFGVGLEGAHWSASLSLLYHQGRLFADLDQSIVVRTMTFSLEACGMSKPASFRLGGCAVVSAGFVQGQGEGFLGVASSIFGTTAVGANFMLRYQRSRHRLSLLVGPRVMPNRASFTTRAPALDFKQSLGALSVRLLWGVHWGDEG